MSNNDGAAVAQCMAVGEELSRLMVQADYLREENERLREALRFYACKPDCGCKPTERDDPDCGYKARSALEEKE